MGVGNDPIVPMNPQTNKMLLSPTFITMIWSHVNGRFSQELEVGVGRSSVDVESPLNHWLQSGSADYGPEDKQ